MPPKKKKRTQPKKVVKKPRGSSTKKKKAEDKPWKSSLKFESRETPDGSRSNTPSCYDNNGKSRNSSMTSRDFIRQVLEYDKASESDLESEECEDDDQSSDIELKMAIKDSLSNEENTIGVNVDQYSDSDNDDSILNDDSVLTNGEKTVSNDVGVDGDLDSTHDSSANFSQDAATSEPLSSSSVYAPMPEFLPDDMPTLKLPPSSDDLLIAKEYVLRAAGVYEILRVYGQILRLSPFIFEEFIASMTDVLEFEYNPLIHEVHSCLIKTLLREEDNNQTSFGPVDLKDSMNSLFFFNDAMTYPHVIREYLRSDSDKEFQLALGYISEPDYLNGAVEKKLNVLEVLCNLILSSNSIREELSADGFIKYEDHCRVCQKTGDVLCCDKCSGVYHLYCLDPPLDQLPEGDWACNVCSDSEVPGVTDCINSTEKRSMNRNDPLGFDRHWRKYWFLVRRIIIEDSNGDVTYVSTAKQFDRLLECLDEKWERQLVSVLRQRREEILEHMAITVHLTEERRGQRQSYLTKEDIELEKLQEEDLKETRDTKDAVNARNGEINNKPDTSDVVGKHNSLEKAGASADDDQKASMKVATTVPGSQPVGDGGASVTIKTAVTPITLELSDFVGNQTAKLSRLLPNPDDKSTTTIENQDSGPTLSTQGQLQSVADNEPIAKTLADIEIGKSQGTDPEYLDIEMLQSDISTSEPVPEHLLVEEVATEEAVITEEFVVAEESVVTTDIAAETDVVKELIDQAASNESNARDLMEETQLYEGQDLDNEALDLQEGLALDEVEDVEANLGQTVVLGDVTASGIAADGVSDKKTQVIIGGNDADGCEDFMEEGLDEFSGESSDSEEDIPSDVDYFDNGLVNVIDEMNSSAEMSGDDELGSLESGEIGEEDEEGRVWSDSEMEGSDGDLGASDDGQVMDTDEEAGETSDSLDDMDELSRVDDENSALGYEDQLDGTVDSEVSDKNTVAASTQQQIIINTSASNIGQPKDTPIIIKTASGCQSIKLVNVSSGANGNYKAEVSGPVQKLGQADDVSTASSGTHAVKVLAVPQTKLVKTPTQGIVNLDKFGNIVGWGKNATAAIKQTIVSKVTGSQAGPAHVLKTYGKKPAVITVPVTATVDQYKSEHPSTQPSSEAAGLLNTVTTTVVTPQTLLTTIASPKSITLSTNAQTSANAKPTLQVLNVSPQTGNKSVTLVTPSSANQIVTIPSQMVSVGNQKLSASNHKVVVSNQKVLGTNQIVTLPNQGKLATNIEVIRNSAGMPIKLLRGTNSTGAVGTVVVSSNDGTKPPFTKVVQKIQQGSPSVSSHGGIMRIISDKSGKLSTSEVSSIVNRVVSSNTSTTTSTVTSVGVPATSKYCLLSPVTTVKSTPQKILIGTASDGATVLKTQTGEAKVINLSGQTPGSFPGSQSQFAMKLVNKSGASVTSASIIRPIISAPIQRLVQPTLPKRLVQPMPLISKQVKPQIFTQGGQPRMIRPRKDENLTGGIVPQTVVLVDKDGKRSTVTVDARTLRNDAHTTLTTIQKKGSADELVSLRIVNDKAKVIPSVQKPLIPHTIDSSDKSPALRTMASLKARQELAQNRQKLEMKIAKVLAASKDDDEEVDIIKSEPVVPAGPFKLGMDSGYKNYINQYTENPHALSKNQQQEERDKKRHLSYKFSLTSASEFKWQGRVYGTPTNIMDTLKETMIQFEEAIPLCFMHPHWSTLRSFWIKALNCCHTTDRFVTVLGLFQCNIKPVLFNAVWSDSLGHLSVFRQTAKDKEDIRRKEKLEKRQQDLLEQNPLQQLRISAVKYSKRVKHQLYKLKGEEYRISDVNGTGWIWLKASRRLKSMPADHFGHGRHLREKRNQFSEWKKKVDSKENTAMDVSPPSNMIDFDLYRGKTCELVDVSAELLSRNSMYPNLAITPAKVNSLLRHRLLLEKIIHQKLKKAAAQKTAAKVEDQQEIKQVKVDPMDTGTVQVKVEPMDTGTAPSTDSSTKPNSSKTGHAQNNSTHDVADKGAKCFYQQCYSPTCMASKSSSKCYSSLCPSKLKFQHTSQVKISTPIQPVPHGEANAVSLNRQTGTSPDSFDKEISDPVVTRTKERIDLFPVFEAARKVAGKKSKSERPVVCRPHKYRTRSGKSCPFVLVREELKALARKGGKMDVANFNYSCKNAPGFWPYPCPRPRFKMGWEYRLNNCISSIHGVANQLRVLWACVRWDDMNTKPPAGGSNVSTNDSDITTREILEKKDVGPTKLQSLYRVRTIVIPFNFMEQPTRIDSNEPIREGLRKRKKHQMKQPAQPSTSVAWLPEEQLELWEITSFSEKAALSKIERHDKPKKSKKFDKSFTKVPQFGVGSTGALTTLQKPKDPEELSKVKAQLEEQLKLQRAAAQAQRLGLKPADNVKLEPVPTPPGSIITIKGSDGKEMQLKGMAPGQQLLRLPNGKYTIMTKETLSTLKKSGTIAGELSTPRSSAPISITPAPAVVSLSAPGTTGVLSSVTTSALTSSVVTVAQASTAGAAGALSTPSLVTPSAPSLVVSSAPSVVTLTAPSVVTLAAPSVVTLATPTIVSTSPSAVSTPAPSVVTLAAPSIVASSAPCVVTLAAPAAKVASSDSDMKPLTPSNIRASLVQAQVLSLSAQSPASPPVITPAAALSSAKQNVDLKQDHVDVEESGTTQETNSQAEDVGSADDEDTTLSTDVVQQVVARALSSTQAPEIQSRLQEMQRKLATVQGIITVSKQKPKSPERLVSEYHEEMKSKLAKPVSKTMFEPKVPTQEELEMARQRKLKNKEEYKKRKAKDRLKKLAGLLEKQKALLKKDIKARQEVLKHKVRKEIRDEIFTATGAVIDMDPHDPAIFRMGTPRIPIVQMKRTIIESKISNSTESSSKSSTPSTTPIPIRSARPSTSQYAKKRKLCVSSEPISPTMPSKVAKATITKPKSLQNKLYCVCQTPLDKSRFYVGCDICAQWFHGSCVGISEYDRTINSFTCDQCKQHQQKSSEELYCLCNKPYNDAQFYVGCDQCEGWFHPSCVGITKDEAESTDTYVCPTCKSKGSATSMYEISMRGHVSSLKRVIKSLQTHEMAWPFLKAVDPAKVPDYYQVVREPMDLATLFNKLRTDNYKTVGDFVKDATKIFNNARYYNSADSPIFLCAEKLEKFFVQQLKDLKLSNTKKS